MGEKTKITWTHHTFNPWWGCVRVSDGCRNCYAITLAHRFGYDVWGSQRNRRLFGDKHWREPLRWNAEAQKAGERHRVFAGSMCDVFELNTKFRDELGHLQLDYARMELFKLIKLTPWLDWLLVTKRPENIKAMLPMDWSVNNYPNVWLIATVENQTMADARIPTLLSVPAVVHGLSCEPLLEHIDVAQYLNGAWSNSDKLMTSDSVNVDWVIVGGESGYRFRQMDLDWARWLRNDCAEYNVPFFFKQESGLKPGENALLDGVEYHEFPLSKQGVMFE